MDMGARFYDYTTARKVRAARRGHRRKPETVDLEGRERSRLTARAEIRRIEETPKRSARATYRNSRHVRQSRSPNFSGG